MTYNIHQAAEAFPMMEAKELKELSEDVKRNGLQVAIKLYDGQIIDGRNRLKACEIAGVTPSFEKLETDDPFMWVWSLNGERRHLQGQEQKYLIWDELHGMSDQMQAERDRIKKEADKARGDAQKGKPKNKEERSRSDRPTTSKTKENKTRKAEAKAANVNESAVKRANTLKKADPELAKQVAQGKIKYAQANKIVKQKQIAKARAEVAGKAATIKPSDRYKIECCDLADYTPPEQVDLIITDPPYPREFLPCFETLAIKANEWLKDGGLCIIMSGQSYLDQVYAMMSKHMDYHWTAAYLMPGGQCVQVFPRKVNTFWKPLLIYSKKEYDGKWFGDVCKSAVNNNDKDHHKWGQSISGMDDILTRFTSPGQTVLDPFLGAGTTGVSAIKHDCNFYGCDTDQKNCNISKSRINDALKL